VSSVPRAQGQRPLPRDAVRRSGPVCKPGRDPRLGRGRAGGLRLVRRRRRLVAEPAPWVALRRPAPRRRGGVLCTAPDLGRDGRSARTGFAVPCFGGATT